MQIWPIFLSLRSQAPTNSMGAGPIRFSDLAAYCRIFEPLPAWKQQLILEADACYLSAFYESQERQLKSK